MSSNRRGIPTVYRGIQFRSRVEARWAAFFDVCEWPWQYEPFDLNGYIPDFVLQLKHPIIVEVKHASSVGDLEEHLPKIERSGWSGEALIVGATPFPAMYAGLSSLGLLAERADPDGRFNRDGSVWMWAEAPFQICLKCKRPSFYHSEQHFGCRASGCYDGDGYLGTEFVDPFWARACNATQWKRP